MFLAVHPCMFFLVQETMFSDVYIEKDLLRNFATVGQENLVKLSLKSLGIPNAGSETPIQDTGVAATARRCRTGHH